MYSIHPIECGTLIATKSAHTYRVDEGVPVEFPVYAFLVVADDPGDDTAILVDTGVASTDSPFMRERDREVGPPGGGPEPLVDGLADHGVDPADVDHVILTHLHHDHAANCEVFEGAEFLFQRRALEDARDPLPVFADTYLEDTVETLESLETTPIDGGFRLREGIDLIPTPGHTRGSQSVIVETAEGPCALIADLAYSRHNLDPGRSDIRDANGDVVETTPVDADYLPPGILVDVDACYESIARLRERIGENGVLLPGHDAEITERVPQPDRSE